MVPTPVSYCRHIANNSNVFDTFIPLLNPDAFRSILVLKFRKHIAGDKVENDMYDRMK
jgi:hypothetical protein